MSSLIAFHRLAAARADGLDPRILDLLERRATLIEANPRVVEIAAAGGFVQAGPCPQPKMPEFLPGNVVGFVPKNLAAQATRKSSAS